MQVKELESRERIMNKEHSRPFNIEHARANAPYSTRDGRKAEVLKWDAKNSYKFPLIGYVKDTNGDESSVSWMADGACVGRDMPSPLDLVMRPLGFVDGRPVFVGDEIERMKPNHCFPPNPAWGKWEKHKVTPTDSFEWINTYHFRWPIPEPVTNLSDEGLRSLYMANVSAWNSVEDLRAFANAVIRRYIEEERAK